MTDKRISDLPEYTGDLDPNDLFEYIDTSDTTDHASGSSRKIKSGRVGFTARAVVPALAGVRGPTIPGTVHTGALSGTLLYTDGIFLGPLTLHRKITVLSATVVVTGASASSSMRMGIYYASASFVPGTLVYDWGTVSTTTTGRKTATTSSVLEPGNYYLAAVGSTSSLSVVLQRVQPLTLAGTLLRPDFTSNSNMGVDKLVVTHPGATAGGLPSSLGAFAAVSASSSAGIATPVFLDWDLA